MKRMILLSGALILLATPACAELLLHVLGPHRQAGTLLQKKTQQSSEAVQKTEPFRETSPRNLPDAAAQEQPR